MDECLYKWIHIYTHKMWELSKDWIEPDFQIISALGYNAFDLHGFGSTGLKFCHLHLVCLEAYAHRNSYTTNFTIFFAMAFWMISSPTSHGVFFQKNTIGLGVGRIILMNQDNTLNLLKPVILKILIFFFSYFTITLATWNLIIK